MASCTIHLVTFVHFAPRETINIPGRTTCNDTSESTTLTKTRTTHNSEKFSPNGPKVEAGEEDDESGLEPQNLLNMLARPSGLYLSF